MLSKAEYRPGVVKDDTPYSAEGYAVGSDKIRWDRGRAQAIGGYEDQLGGEKLSGIGRSLFAWTDTLGNNYEAVGTNQKLYAVNEGVSYDITPIQPPIAGYLGIYIPSSTFGITLANHGLRIGDHVYLYSTDNATNNLGRNGTFAAGSFLTQGGAKSVIVTIANHGFASGGQMVITGFTPFNGVDLNGQHSIKVVDANTFLIYTDTAATGSGTGGGTPTWVLYKEYAVTDLSTSDPLNEFYVDSGVPSTLTSTNVTVIRELGIGRVDAIKPGGYSLGTYGTNRYGYSTDPRYRSEYLPRTWAFDNLGELLVANPLGGGVFLWGLNPTQRAEIIPNAPLQNDYMTVTAEGAIMVFGTIMTDNTYDPLGVRWSDIRTSLTGTTPWETWTPSAANASGEWHLSTGSYIVGAKKVKNGICVFTDTALNIAQFTTNTAVVYAFDLLATGCGLAGPNAVVEKDGKLYWITPKVGFHAYSSGSPVMIPCPVRMFSMNRANWLQSYKSYAAYDALFNGIIFGYQSNDGSDVDSYVRVDLNEVADANSGWSIGTTDMTAWLDRSPLEYPSSVRIDGMLCWQDKGRSANGDALERFIEFAPIEMDGEGMIDGTYVLNVSRVVFDAKIEGDIELTLQLRRWPNAPLVTKGPYPQDGTTQYQGIRGQGRQCGFLWRSYGIEDYWRLGAIRYDISQGPRR